MAETGKPARIKLGYIRVSNDEQRAEGVSLAVQEEKILAYARLAFEDGDLCIKRDVESGKDLRHREGMMEIIAMIQRGQVSDLVILRLDRLTRNIKDLLNLVDLFEKKDVTLHSLHERIDTKTATGKFFLTILGALAQMEREMISERTKLALQYKKKMGQRTGEVPFGYAVGADGKTLIPIQQEQTVLNRIKGYREDGLSYERIAKVLNENGIRTKTGRKKWYGSSVHSILEHQ